MTGRCAPLIVVTAVSAIFLPGCAGPVLNEYTVYLGPTIGSIEERQVMRISADLSTTHGPSRIISNSPTGKFKRQTKRVLISNILCSEHHQ